jgi:glutamyl-tRNA synthetase
MSVHTMPLDELLPLVKTELRANKLWREEYDDEDSEWFRKTVDLIRRQFSTVQDFSSRGRAYFSDDFDFEEDAVSDNLRREPRLRELLKSLADKLDEVEPFNAERSEAVLRAFADEARVEPDLLINASQTMLTGHKVGPSVFEIFEVLGRESSVQRLKSGVPWNL